MTSRAFAVVWSNGRGQTDKLEERRQDAALETKEELKASVGFDVAE